MHGWYWFLLVPFGAFVGGIIRGYVRSVREHNEMLTDMYRNEAQRLSAEIAAVRDAEQAARRERMMASLAQAPPSMNVPAGLYARPGRVIPVDDNADRVISVSPYDRPWVSDVLIPAPVGPRGPEQEAELARQAAAPQIPLDELVANTKTEDRTRYWIARKR